MDNIDKKDIEGSIRTIEKLLKEAYDFFYEFQYQGGDRKYYDLHISYRIEQAFLSLLVLLESLDLLYIHQELNASYQRAKKNINDSAMGYEDPYLVWAEKVQEYLDAVKVAFNVSTEDKTIKKDLESIIKSSLYSITDKTLFKKPPQNEAEVHARIEAVLKCVLPNLKHKPLLSKPIKNFEPDTGLSSLKTLIEYKFISDMNDAKRVSDEILADISGYVSRDWDSFLFVIYETHRVIEERKWKEHLRECGIDRRVSIIVLSGEPKKIKKKNSHEKA